MPESEDGSILKEMEEKRRKSKRSVHAVLNKSKLDRFEMDEVFLG